MLSAPTLLALMLFPQTLLAQKRPLGLGMTSTAEVYADATGQNFSFVCPASDGGTAYVYGTDVYTHNSPICKAAIHAGALPPRVVGVVTITMGGPVDSFAGSTRNGVTTSSYRAWPRSYRFVPGAVSGGTTWETVWSNVPGALTTAIRLECPPGGPGTGGVWGTTVYAGGSSICAAAVHAGAITAAQGGAIEVRSAVPSGEFVASVRNGVTSQRWASQPEAFTVRAAAPGQPLAPVAGSAEFANSEPATLQNPATAMHITSAFPGLAGTSSAAASGPKTINTGGFTRIGNGALPTDVVLHVPLNLTRLNPMIATVRIVCEVGSIGLPRMGGRGGSEVAVTGGQYTGTVAVRAPTNAVPGTNMRYYCTLSAIDATGNGFNHSDIAQAQITADFTW